MPIKQSPFAFRHFLVEESHIIRKPNIRKHDFDINIEPSGINDLNEKIFQLGLLINLKDKKSDCKISIKAVGLFSFKRVTNNSDLSNYFLVNAPAIIYPYVRSYIAALTALSGMEAIHIPVMSMTSISEKLRNNIQVIE